METQTQTVGNSRLETRPPTADYDLSDSEEICEWDKVEQEAFYAIEEITGISKDQILSPSRKKHISYARRYYCALLRNQNIAPTMTLDHIGKSINRDHATVMHHVARHGAYIELKYGDYCENWYRVYGMFLKKVINITQSREDVIQIENRVRFLLERRRQIKRSIAIAQKGSKAN